MVLKEANIHTALQSNFLNFNTEAKSDKDIIDGNNLISIARQLRIHGEIFTKVNLYGKLFNE
jgi:hypothetical protein